MSWHAAGSVGNLTDTSVLGSANPAPTPRPRLFAAVRHRRASAVTSTFVFRSLARSLARFASPLLRSEPLSPISVVWTTAATSSVQCWQTSRPSWAGADVRDIATYDHDGTGRHFLAGVLSAGDECAAVLGSLSTGDIIDLQRTPLFRRRPAWPGAGATGMNARRLPGVIHLELHTYDAPRAVTFLSALLGWSAEEVVVPITRPVHPIVPTGGDGKGDEGGSYLSLRLGNGVGGGVVECGQPQPFWLPYVRVHALRQVTQRAQELGASVLLSPREGHAGWRSVVTDGATGDIAFWQPKTRWCP
jgi:predicted enzyme related to lactoylglutathione lyase